jgi:hypothetical protein
MIRLSLSVPQQYKDDFFALAEKEGISASELLRCWIREKKTKEEKE